MEQRRKLKEEILMGTNLKMLTRTYQEHAIEQINFARYSVIASREFSDQLEEVFINVKTSYRNALQNALMGSKKGKVEFPIRKKNGKEILVLVTANNKLYGEIITKICRLFYEQAKASSADIAVIGKQGQSFIEATDLKKQFVYFEIPDSNVTENQLNPIITKLLEYDKVTVFHGKYNNMVSQEAVEAYVSGDIPEKEQADSKETFLFEPTVENILDFFERQIFSLLLNQTIQEAQLARFASRIKAMELAQQNMSHWLEMLGQRERKLKNALTNKKQLELFAGRSLWRKR